MGHAHPLDGRGLPRDGRGRPDRFTERLGRALLALSLLASAAAGQDEDPTWQSLYQAWAQEFQDIRARLALPAEHEQALADYRAATARLEREARALALPLYHKAYELGASSAYTPELEGRLAFLELAARAAALCGEEAFALRAEHERADALARADRRSEARAALETALARYPGAGRFRAYPTVTLAELARELGDPGRALELAAGLEGELAADPEVHELLPEVERIRDYARIDLGLPDLAWDGIVARWRRAEERGAGDDEARADRREARLQYLHLLRAVDDGEGVLDAVERFLRDPALEPEEEARLLLLAGASQRELDGRSSAAATRLRRALELGLDRDGQFFVHLELAELALAGGRADEAARELEAAHALLSADEEARESTQEASHLVTLDARLALARGAPPDELEHLRGRLERALGRQLELWRRVPEREGGIGYLLYARRRELAGEHARVCVALDREHGAERAFAQFLALQAQGTLARREAAPAVELAEVRRELLAPGHGLLVYATASACSHVFALDEQELVHAELPANAELERLRLAYLALVLAPARDLEEPAQRDWLLAQERERARALAEALFPAEVRARLRAWSRVTIVGPDGFGGPLPFEWLPLEGEPYLGVARALDYLPSVPLGVAWARRPERAFARDYLLVGGVPADGAQPGLEPILLGPELERELCAPFGAAEVLRGERATRAGFLGQDLGATRVLQFLVHGVEVGDEGHERELALLLGASAGDDGLLRRGDVARVRAPGLVLLTGCRTGAGPTRRGDPLSAELAGAWLGGGARAVLLARKDVTLSEVRAFSAEFAPPLAAGVSPAEALRAARAASVRAHGAEAPFRQGLLQLFGLGQRPLFAAPAAAGARWKAWLPGALVGFALGYALARLRRGRAVRRISGSGSS